MIADVSDSSTSADSDSSDELPAKKPKNKHGAVPKTETTLKAKKETPVTTTTTALQSPSTAHFKQHPSRTQLQTPASRSHISNRPFERVPKDFAVKPEFADNTYRPSGDNAYADRAHHDLIVTKGKGFTKEKNKKKRGSYRGGYIDTSGSKAIKFE
jgi:hypothetical protein